MAIPSNTPTRVDYLGNNTTAMFSFPFRALNANEVAVKVINTLDPDAVEIDLVLNTDFTVAALPFPLLGGSISLIDVGQDWMSAGGNLDTGWRIDVDYVVSPRQLTSYRNLGPYAPIELEKSFDKITMDLLGVNTRLTDNDAEVEQLRIDVDTNTQDIATLQADTGDITNLQFDGFSARFGELFSSNGLLDTLEKILDLTYVGPLVTLSGTSNILREKGDTVSSIDLTAAVVKRSDPIAKIEFFQGVTPIANFEPPANVNSGNQVTTYATPFSDVTSFTVEVTDTGDTGGPTTVTSNTVTYNFVYPYYSGAAAPGRTPAQVAALTKDIRVSTATLAKNFTTVDGDVYYFAYPASYGALTRIDDINGFDVTGSFTQRTENITGLDGNPVSYYIYESNNPVVAGSTTFTFRR